MAIEGPLRELALSDVFQLLDLSRKTGTLTIRAEGRTRPATIRFDRGAVVGAELWGENGGRIGHLLLRAGKVTEAEVEIARREQQLRPGWPLGSILMDMGFVSADDVRRQLHFQIEEAVFDLIRWTDGDFRFEETAGHDDVALPIRMSTESLLMEAARRIDEWTLLEARIPNLSVIPALVGFAPGGALLDLTPDEWEVLAEIDGERSVRTVAADLGRSDFETARLVHGMIASGLLEILVDAPVVRPASTNGSAPSADGVLEEAARALADGEAARALRLLQRRTREWPDPAALVLLGRTLGALNRWGDAARTLARAVAGDPLLADAHYQLGFSLARTGELRGAEEAWATYLRLAAGDPGRNELAARGRQAALDLRAVLEGVP